ncbi:MAG TPA: HD domain-containing protein [archaeon]|nr:HD domain-containing protein [archaeon]
MDENAIIEKTKEYVKKSMEYGDVGHDWFHIERVWKMAKMIAQKENGNMLVVELGALLHDIADWKFYGVGAGEEKARTWLVELGLENKVIEDIIHIIENVSFKGVAESEKMNTLEGKIVQDADRLDAMGAIGIARACTYVGFKNIPIHDPTVNIRKNMDFSEYKNTAIVGTAINHFYEKLLFLKDRMNTETGKKLAEQRHEFMELYLDQFFKEANGER